MMKRTFAFLLILALLLPMGIVANADSTEVKLNSIALAALTAK